MERARVCGRLAWSCRPRAAGLQSLAAMQRGGGRVARYGAGTEQELDGGLDVPAHIPFPCAHRSRSLTAYRFQGGSWLRGRDLDASRQAACLQDDGHMSLIRAYLRRREAGRGKRQAKAASGHARRRFGWVDCGLLLGR